MPNDSIKDNIYIEDERANLNNLRKIISNERNLNNNKLKNKRVIIINNNIQSKNIYIGRE